MARKTCSVCAGLRGYNSTERVPNPAGGMFMEIQVRKPCMGCGGTGSIWVPDPVPQIPRTSTSSRRGTAVSSGSAQPGKRQTSPPRTRAPSTPEETDAAFANLASLVLSGFMIRVMFYQSVEAELWVKWTIIGVTTALFRWILHSAKRATRLLRYATIIAIAGYGITLLTKLF